MLCGVPSSIGRVASRVLVYVEGMGSCKFRGSKRCHIDCFIVHNKNEYCILYNVYDELKLYKNEWMCTLTWNDLRTKTRAEDKCCCHVYLFIDIVSSLCISCEMYY